MKLKCSIALTLCTLLLLHGCVQKAATPNEMRSANPFASPTPTTSNIPAETVSFCDLIRNPKLYDKKIIRTNAYVVNSSETSVLYSLDCAGKDKSIWIEIENQDAFDAIYPFITLGRSNPAIAQVTVVGRFENSDKPIYGHLNGFRSQFSILAVEKAEAVNSDSFFDGKH